MSNPDKLTKKDAEYLVFRTILFDVYIIFKTLIGKGIGDKVKI